MEPDGVIQTCTNKHFLWLLVGEGGESCTVEREVGNHRQRGLLFAHTAFEWTDDFEPRLCHGLLGLGQPLGNALALYPKKIQHVFGEVLVALSVYGGSFFG